MAASSCLFAILSCGRNHAKLSSSVVNLCNVAYEPKYKKDDHAYRNVNSWKSKRELADHIVDNLILNRDGLLVFNKPYGVGVSPVPTSSKALEILPKSYGYNLHDVLPYLGNSLGIDRLIVAKSSGKFTSGVLIMATSDKAFDRFKTCQRRERPAKKLTSKYLGVVMGEPLNENISESVKVALTSSPDGKTLQPIIYGNKKPALAKDAISVAAECRTLCTNGHGASLVEIKSNTTKWHFLRVYMAHKLAPLLGDDMYGSRVKYVAGLPVAMNPFNIHSRSTVSISPSIRTRLGLEEGEEITIPCHLHLQEYTFLGWNRDGSDLTVNAPIPSFFDWTCKQLNLINY
ncbi:mitochondrial mRNA pseudouridine synthase RPUSD3-like [Ischnura elegans]|uniref:mitochondrial mRNA pseudouridine synthase RPUSD3-like n=1 Tax=Ischnura elegans TaxID=197161 RepID=UPI001ED8AE67|nr:mitochondrial mRNA pseudouridine synthase RPUSD3-like [Ischnura elegans]